MSLRQSPIHRSGIRPHLLLGGDRELVLFSGLLAGALTVTSFQWVAIVAGVVIWIASLFLLRQMAKADPRMRDVYMRQLLYRRYYPARSRPYRKNIQKWKKW
jgi:type IV secretion system protein TrbD